ncbi:pro-sigmaK processing inhibitor BofA family protein [Clostridium sp. AL.422]|uniref:pro-sigmaK processing inhibitor BofA family protein n=1 Tax=Clostridium TaxID=1485 RepID=UPI00293DA31C|nr:MULTISPECIES: pro-sigmaK processing inhibitor BofA family protein [unclassified Clostridium]MDV4149550.1 pro-sigmaK processing inhibitor BofA family protein [Clostridium sp. AL.422]
MDINLMLYGLIGLVLLYLLIKVLKWPLKILMNGIIGIVLLYFTNLLGAYFDFSIGINWITALIAGFLGVPGVIFLVIFQLFL